MQRPDPRTTSVIAGTRLDLLEAMETLEREHPQFVEPLLLRDVYGLPYEEIATLIGAPLGTIKAQIHHGRKLVRPDARGVLLSSFVSRLPALGALLLTVSLVTGCRDDSTASSRPAATPPTAAATTQEPSVSASLPSRDRRTARRRRPGPRPGPERAGRGLGLPRHRRPERRLAALRPRPGLDAGHPHAGRRGDHRAALDRHRRPPPARPRRAARRLGGDPRRRRRAVRAPGQGPRGQRAGHQGRAVRARGQLLRHPRAHARHRPNAATSAPAAGRSRRAARRGRCRSRTARSPGTPSTTSPPTRRSTTSASPCPRRGSGSRTA